uniref:PAS domain-containing protein n=1 Tax=Candidatus Protofrankia californiensis TaxID=1839754 RepID=UPI0010418036
MNGDRQRNATSGDQLGELPVGYAVTAAIDAHGIVTAWSDDACRLLGYAPAEIVGTTAVDLLVGEVPGPARRAVVNGQGWGGLVTARHRDGHGLAVGVRTHPLLDAGGKVTQWFVAAVAAQDPPKDTQDPHEDVDDLALLDWAFTQAPIGLAITDTEQRIRRLNAEVARMLGSAEDDLRGRWLMDAFPHPAYNEVREHLRQVVATGEPAHYETFRRAQSESRKRAWAVRTSPVRDPAGRVRGAFTASLDISEQYWAQQRLTLLNEANTAIGSTLDVERTAQELADIAVPRFADWASVDLLDTVYRGNEPAPGGITSPVTLRCIGHKSALSGEPEVPIALGQIGTYLPDSPIARALATGHAIHHITTPDSAPWH